MQISSTLARYKLISFGIILLVLATFDALFTDFGIKNQFITESNPIMRRIYEMSVSGFYLIKIALPVLLIVIITKLEMNRFILFLLSSAVLLYVSVVMLHFYWLTVTFISK
ncbi:DUF5658 family protein [Psychrobacillus sp. NPDC096623]|uniref:DUF5658 family protein n=1 Tax=Psychrobacillus sp. NPDC096623 TaxID=3364492 RepID=UPI0037F2C2BF